MPLLEPEKQFPARFLFFVGVPAYITAVLCSMLLHHYAHDIVQRHVCFSAPVPRVTFIIQTNTGEDSPDCPLASLAGVGSTIALGCCAFGLLIHYPKNIFFASLAFVNASMRLPGALRLTAQMILKQKTLVVVDEGNALHLLHFKDPTAYIAILCLYVIGLFFFTIIIIHDTKMVPWKWVIAILLFISLTPFEQYLWTLAGPLIS